MIQLKQLKRLKYESFDYGKYEKLKQIFLNIDFEPEDLEELELSNEKAPSLPNIHCLQLLTNLQVLVISHNLIKSFSGQQLSKSLPKLQVFDISDNLIEELDDIVDMGGLQDLHILDIQGNFVMTYITRINMIEMLLCPKKYIKYNPVKILTASYNQIPVARLQGHAYDQQRKDRRVIERFPEELRPEELINTVSKFNHKNTLGKYSLEACPIPRITRFRNLEYLNGVVITKLDLIRVTGVKHYKQVLEDKNNIKSTQPQAQKQPPKVNRQIHEEYLKKYLKRMNRQAENNEEQHNLKTDELQDVQTSKVQLARQEKNNHLQTEQGGKQFSQNNFWKDMERVKISGDLSKFEFKKVKIPLESLVPSVEQGVPEELRVKFLFDDKNEKYRELVHYKEILEESKNIRAASKELDGKLEIQGIKGRIETKPSDFDTVFTYLKQDPTFQIQNSYDPGNMVTNAVGRKRRGKLLSPQSNVKMSTFDMREIVYGANEYDPQDEPKIVEKEIFQQLSKEKGISVEQRNKLYEWLAILDDINLKKNKTDDKRLQRIERKELERASSFAHLAYHYQKLKKYVPEDKLQKYVKLMGIPLDDIIQENQQQTKIPRVPAKSQAKTITITESKSLGSIKQRPMTTAPVSRKEPDPVKEAQRIVAEKAEMINREQEVNARRFDNLKKEILSENGFMAEHNPNLVEFLRDKDRVHAQVVKPQYTFEEMMDQNVRRLQDQFQKKGGSSAFSLEEQMMRYAQEVNEKQKNRERLKANIKQYIDGTQKKIDEFWQWEATEREQRNDKSQCFRRYVRLVREGQIKII